MAELSYAEICEIEPLISNVMLLVDYGGTWGVYEMAKICTGLLVGHNSQHDDRRLHTSAAYETVMREVVARMGL